MRIFKKKIPAGEKELDAVVSWAVRWSMNTIYRKEHAEFFIKEEEAREFARVLIKAAELLKMDFYTSPYLDKTKT